MQGTEQKKNTRETLEANIRDVEKRIASFNSHWLNHKHITSAFAVFIMAVIFTGMLIPAIELTVWRVCGGSILFFIGIMLWRTRQAKLLNKEMEAGQQAFKKYERSRRKK